MMKQKQKRTTGRMIIGEHKLKRIYKVYEKQSMTPPKFSQLVKTANVLNNIVCFFFFLGSELRLFACAKKIAARKK